MNPTLSHIRVGKVGVHQLLWVGVEMCGASPSEPKSSKSNSNIDASSFAATHATEASRSKLCCLLSKNKPSDDKTCDSRELLFMASP